MQPTTSDLRTAYEQALAEEAALEQIMIAAEILAADNTIAHIKAFHDAESEYMAAWDRTAQAYTRWHIQWQWDRGMAA
jgi:hypothetical protein